ncbi:MAG: hypothetical protein ACKO5K_07540, partial [Armatimonadota bacterium]
GPQSINGGRLPDGAYYYQVTDPSVKVLLSTDSVRNRRLRVQGGHVLGALPDPIEPMTYPGHPNGQLLMSPDRQGVRLFPYDTTPNGGGVYKVWMTPVASFAPDQGSFGFLHGQSKTDNFKVQDGGGGPSESTASFVIRKYEDRNANGANDLEPVLDGWHFQVQVTDAQGNAVATLPVDPVTGEPDANGTTTPGETTVNTAVLVPSQYPLIWTIREVQRPNWRQTDPSDGDPGAAFIDGQWVYTGTLVNAAGGVVVVEFGNAHYANISGLKYHDMNGNGTRDAGEPPLAGFSFEVTVAGDSTTVVSGADGVFTSGPHLVGSEGAVREIGPDAPWRQTEPAMGGGHSGTLDADVTGLSFGNARYYPIRGVKYHDRNGNGTRDTDEPGLDGWTFHLSVDGMPVGSAVSGMDGTWRSEGEFLEGLPVMATEEPREDWRQTEPALGQPARGLVDGESVLVFGNARLLPIEGFKYEDRNGNGQRDPGEQGVGGFWFDVVVTSMQDGPQAFRVESGADGTWALPGRFLEGSTYVASEDHSGPRYWYQTEPAMGAGYSGILADPIRLVFGNAHRLPLHGRKYYDSNANGRYDDPVFNTGLGGIRIRIHVVQPEGAPVIDEEAITNPDGTWCSPGEYLAGSTFTVCEVVPTGWVGTAPVGGCHEGTIGNDPVFGLNFLNFRLGGDGGRTLGFWSNKNGQALVGSDDLAMLRSMNLVNGNGTAFDPLTKDQLRTFLLGATSTNMANMLSAQLAAMCLNVHNGLVDASALVYAPGAAGANAFGAITVGALCVEANAELGLHPSTPSGSPYRAYQGWLKDALDNANNNRNFILPTP